MLDKIFGIIGLIFGIVGIYLTIKSIRKKRPLYVIQNANLINNQQKINKPLKLLYNDYVIDNMTITNIVFWNAGNDTLSSQDLPLNSKLYFMIGQESVIIDFNILNQTIDTNGTTLRKVEKNKLQIDFDYYDSKQGFILQIFHTEKNFEAISLHGIFKGALSLKRTKSNSDKDLKGIIGVFILACFGISSLSLNFLNNIPIYKYFLYSALIILMLYILIIATKELVSILRDGIPKSLADFNKL